MNIENFFKGKIKIPLFDEVIANGARKLQNELTKPPGSLGKLEEYAIWMAGWQKKIKPTIENVLTTKRKKCSRDFTLIVFFFTRDFGKKGKIVFYKGNYKLQGINPAEKKLLLMNVKM